MGRNELENKLVAALSKINMNGLDIIESLVSNMEKSEKYSISTSEERLIEIAREEKEARETEQAEYEQKAHQEYMEYMRQETAEREDKIAHLEGKEKKFWEKIEKVKHMGIGPYAEKVWQTSLIAEIYNNNYINASYTEFCYGFYQGMQYEKNMQKKARRSIEETKVLA